MYSLAVSEAWWIFSIVSASVLTAFSFLFALHKYMMNRARDEVTNNTTLSETLKGQARLIEHHAKWLDDHEQRMRNQEALSRSITKMEGDISHMRERLDTDLERLWKKIEQGNPNDSQS